MKRMLMGHFLPPDYDQFLFEQYQSLRQVQKSVVDYTIEFLRLSSRNNLMETEGQQISRYLYGLNPSIRKNIGCQVILSLSEAYNIARRAKSMSSKGNFGGEVNRRSTTAALKQPLKFNAETSTSSNTIQSEQMEKEGGKKPMVNPYTKPTGDKCYRCELKARMQNYTRYDAQSFYDAMIFNMDSLGKYMLELILHQQRTPQLLKQKKLMQTQEDHSNPIPALNVDSLKVDLVVIQNTCSEKEDSNSETASSKSVKECSLNSETKDVHAIKYKMSKAKERCMTYF
ncbi:zinc finger, CCHC-type containing protein [Tanacetum coccineum]